MAGQSGQLIGEAARPVSLGDVLASIRDRLSADERNRLDVEAPPRDVSLVWPLHVVARAIGNVVQNAFDASPAGARVRLEARIEDGSRLAMRVVDQGAGMTAVELERVGDPFFTTKPAGKGTGLGIFVARSTVEQLGGRLTFASSPGQGTTVRIALPVDVVRAGGHLHA